MTPMTIAQSRAILQYSSVNINKVECALTIYYFIVHHSNISTQRLLAEVHVTYTAQ